MKTSSTKDELKAATHASLRARATSVEARGLVADLAALVAKHELLSGARTNRRKDAAPIFEYAVGAFLASLLKPHSSEPAHEWIYRSMQARSFTGKRVSYKTFTRLVDQFKVLNLVEHVGGNSVSVERSDTGKYAARFRATAELLRLCARHGVAPRKALDHFQFEYDLPAEPLQLRATKEKSFYGRSEAPTGKPMDFPRDSVTQQMEGDLRELNEFFSRQSLRGGSHEGYVRIFNNGDDPSFYWSTGGRLYSQHFAESYQTRSSTVRAAMTINDEAVSEIDIRASYLTIFLSWHDRQLDMNADPYVLGGLDTAARSAVKAWMVATFGNKAPVRRWPARMLRNQAELSSYSAAEIAKHAERTYPELATWGTVRRKGHVASWADLMWEESVVMTSSMVRLMREHAVPSLSVHDSLIVPASKRMLAASLLSEKFFDVTGKHPILIINQKGQNIHPVDAKHN